VGRLDGAAHRDGVIVARESYTVKTTEVYRRNKIMMDGIIDTMDDSVFGCPHKAMP